MDVKTKAVGAKIRRIRTDMGLTLKQLSDRAGMSLQLLQRLETGSIRLNIDHLEKIAEALGMRIVDLLDEGSLVEDIYRYMSSNTQIALGDIFHSNGKEMVNLRVRPGMRGEEEQPVLSDSLRMEIVKDLVDEELVSLMVKAKTSLSQESLRKLKDDLRERIGFLMYLEQNRD